MYPTSALKQDSPYLAARLERFACVNVASMAIRELLKAGLAREALDSALEIRILLGESSVPNPLLGECYLACDLVEPAIPLLENAIDPRNGSGGLAAEVYVTNQADRAMPLWAWAISRHKDGGAAAEGTLERYRIGLIGDQGALMAASVMESLGELGAAFQVYDYVFRSSTLQIPRILAMKNLLATTLAKLVEPALRAHSRAGADDLFMPATPGAGGGGKSRVLIASPVRQRLPILVEFLNGLMRLGVSPGDRSSFGAAYLEVAEMPQVDYLFVDDNDDPLSSRMLREFKPPSGQVFLCPMVPDGTKYRCDDITHRWTGDLMEKVATMKDFIIEFALYCGYDYLFLVDSDLVLHPRTLARLQWTGRDIVSEVFWTKWQPNGVQLPQVWLKDHYDFTKFAPDERWDKMEALRRATTFIESLRIPGTYEVGGLGACTLIKTGCLRSGLRFRKIENLSLRGEDRHFCVRAVAMGYSLNAETTYPPLHLYRDEDLARVPGFWNDVEKGLVTVGGSSGPGRGKRLTLSMLVRNEAGRYLAQVLEDAAGYVDNAVILDDASNDDTVDICRSIFREAGIPAVIVSNKEHGFLNEIQLRKQQWELTVSTDPEWILCLDADEIFEEAAKFELKRLLDQEESDTFGFRLYDMWDERHYRDDAYWNAHRRFFYLLTRFRPGFRYLWRETPLHCGRFPVNTTSLPTYRSSLRVKHLGWMSQRDRLMKFGRYMRADPEGKYGVLAQYKSILDLNPRLVRWID